MRAIIRSAKGCQVIESPYSNSCMVNCRARAWKSPRSFYKWGRGHVNGVSSSWLQPWKTIAVFLTIDAQFGSLGGFQKTVLQEMNLIKIRTPNLPNIGRRKSLGFSTGELYFCSRILTISKNSAWVSSNSIFWIFKGLSNKFFFQIVICEKIRTWKPTGCSNKFLVTFGSFWIDWSTYKIHPWK